MDRGTIGHQPDETRQKTALPEPESQDPGAGKMENCFYEIRVKGYLNSKWSDWLEGLEVKYLENGEMILYGPIVDQAALLGVLNKLSRLNLALLSVNQVKKEMETK